MMVKLFLFFGLFLVVSGEETFLYALSFNTIPDASNYNRGSAFSQKRDSVLTSAGVEYFSKSQDETPSAVWLSLVTETQGGASFSEAGNISFGTADDLIFFSSRVDGASQDTGSNSYGTIAYEITGGTGRYSGASGWMVDMYWAFGNAPSFLINAWGWFYLPDQQIAPETTNEEKSPFFKFPFQGRSLPSSHHQNSIRHQSKKNAGSPREKQWERVEFVVIFENTPSNGINHARAPSQSLFTQVSYDADLHFSNTSSVLSTVLNWTSTPVSYQNNTFSNTGTIDLVDEDSRQIYASLKFSSNTLGQSRTSSQEEYGGITYFIESGNGLWDGATGVMVDLYVSPFGSTTSPIYVWALFWLPV